MQTLRIHNSLTGTKEEFVPLHPGRIGIYVCGITVYDYCHIGHGRMLTVFDMVVRYLRSLGYDVTFREYDGRHNVPEPIVREAFTWFRQ